MADWVTFSSLATAGGTLVLAVATFSSVRSANRSARTAERALLAGQRPLLIPSRDEEPQERIRFGDGQFLVVPGHGAATSAISPSSQGPRRDRDDPDYDVLRGAVDRTDRVMIDLLYVDHEGGQRTIGRFSISDWDDVEGERAEVLRYWNLDRDDPRDRPTA